MKTLTPELASARTIGDACALKACSLNAVEDDVLARAETTSGAIKKLDVSENALSDLKFFSFLRNLGAWGGDLVKSGFPSFLKVFRGLRRF